MRSLTAQIMVDDIEADEEGIADAFLDNETIAQAARPGTSLRTAATSNVQSLRLIDLCLIVFNWYLGGVGSESRSG